MKQKILWLASLAFVVGCEGRSVVGGPIDSGAVRDVVDSGADAQGLDAQGVDAPPVDVATFDVFDAEAGAVDAQVDVVDASEDRPEVFSGCRSDDDCRSNELGLLACDTATNRCVTCTATNQNACAANQYCDTTANRCVPGCRDDAACASNPAGTRCNVSNHTCVPCVVDAHCPPGNLCMGNTCVAGCNEMQACPMGQSCCAGGCVDAQSNIAHCGACGNACAVANGSATCMGGRCAVAMCNPGRGDCDTNAANGCETDTRTSAMHCGACGAACAARPNTAASCESGVCAYVCTAGFADCDGEPSNGCEVDLRSTLAHCGACGNVCAPRANSSVMCTAGACAYQCNTGFADCDNNPANGCETDTRTSTGNCGRCGTMCTTGMTCSNGTCGNICQAPTTFCNGQCANTATDVANCGRCANACPTPANAVATCANGACGGTCNAGFGDCDNSLANGCETNVRTSVMHCGACGAACAARANASAACTNGACAYTCNAGFADCDGNPANGCEVDTRSNVSNCGGCGRACVLANATAVCTSGACAIGACNAGFGNCDSMVPNGCETNTTINTSHCGRCANMCATGAVCAASTCSCPVGFTACGGQCVNIAADSDNCGSCGNRCPTGQVCVAGLCRTTCSPGSTLCNGDCVILGNDVNNCGACGNRCPAEHLCSGGVCTPIITTTDIGCADGGREAFTDRTAFPNIAACSGGWSRQGIFPAPLRSGVVACERSGDDGPNPNGANCSSADLCAPGWHLCRAGEVLTRTANRGCAGTTFPADTFYAAAASGTGCGVCALLTGTGTTNCNSLSCQTGCREDPSLNNDFFGCGTYGAGANCDGMNFFSNNDCGALGAPWACNGGTMESITVTKPLGTRGGVLCCR
ncbi:MAG: hypothetical protein JNK72_01710 [Myxococcales bacterium]|nr:hypothetical protein [Myxococcales bacterium]